MVKKPKQIPAPADPPPANTLPAPVAEPPMPAPVVPTAYPWQTAPPGPPGAAIDPPPCSPEGTPFAVAAKMIPAPAAEGYSQKFAEEIGRLSWLRPVLIPQAAARMVPADQKVVEPVHLGKETSAPALDKRLRDAGWKPPEVRPDGNASDATQRK